MAWQIDFSPAANKALTKLGVDTQKRVVRFMRERVANMDDPRGKGKALVGPTLSGFYGAIASVIIIFFAVSKTKKSVSW